MSGASGPEALPGYRPPRLLTEPVARRARPGWTRWRCDLIDDEPDEHVGGVGPGDSAFTRTRRREVPPLGVGHRSLEFRRSRDGDSLLAAARAQARLDGHVGVVSIHRAHLDAAGLGEVRLGWAGATLAGVLAQRRQPGRSSSATNDARGDRRISPDPVVPGTRLPSADVAAIGASVSAVLAAAHGLRPPLIHGAIDTTTIRLDSWGRARLDGFGTGSHDRQMRPEDDVVDLLVALGEAIGGHTNALGERDPTETLISRLLASVSRRQPEVLEAHELHRALDALAVGYTPTVAAKPSPTMPSHPIGAFTPWANPDGRTASLAHLGDDLTVVLDGEYRAGPVGGLPDGMTPLRRLGRGGHGEVWLARDPVLARNVVVKQFHPDPRSDGDSADRDPTDGEPGRYPIAMGHELAALTQLAGHPASTECYGAFIDGPPSLVLSWCSEGPLDVKRHWGLAELAHLGAEVADALAVLHGRGLVHGDVKPLNLLRDRWGTVRLADFSLTSPAGEVAARECSPRHAPPEQLEGGRLTDGVDLAGLAATLFHLAVGRPPLERGDGTEALVARRLAGKTEAPPEALRGLPELSDWVLAWLDPDPRARPPGGAAVAAAALRGMYQPRRLDVQHPEAAPDPGRDRPGVRLATVAAVALTGVLGAVGLGGSDSIAARHFDAGSRPAEAGAAANEPDANEGFEAAGAEAMIVALALPPADPLSAEPVDQLALERRHDRAIVLVRQGQPPRGVAWVVRRDDFSSTGRLVDDQPSAFGLVGRDGTITDAEPTNAGQVILAGVQRSLVMAKADGVSCVRVVTTATPPEVSPPLCWE